MYGVCIFLISFLTTTAALAQSHLVGGKVLDVSNDQPVIGATVRVKGSARGAVTDVNGAFKINAGASDILQVSAVNFTPVEIAAASASPLLVKLKVINKALNEVVVVGYGTAKRSDVTGSVSSVPKERLAQIPVANVLNAMEGAVAGVTITTGTNVPGASPGVLIRGVNTINGRTDPLIVMDGVPYENISLNDVNANDIASIDILKDVSAVAIYGTRGANGVILITTKHGKTGKAAVSLSTYAGVEGFAHKVEPMNGAEYAQKYADWKQQAGVTNDFAVPNQYEQENYAAGKSTDWLKKISQQGFIQDHNLSISGGSPDVKYYVSGEYFSEKGILKGYQNKRASIRTNIDANVTSWLSAGVNLLYVNNNSDGGRVNLQQAMEISPWGRYQNADGSYTIFPMEQEEAFKSPMLGLTTTRNDRRQNIITNAYAEVRPIPGLKYRVNAGYTDVPTLYQSYAGRPSGDISGGTANISNGETKKWIVENIVGYEKTWQKHHLDLTGLYSAQKNTMFSSSITAKGFINDALKFNDVQGATTFSASSEAITSTIVSQMLRVNYGYDSRYLLTATARRDGYSAFGANTSKYGLFPSLAAAWNISNEQFMKGVKAVNSLKLRASYGLSGNQSAVSPNSTITTFTTTSMPSGGKPITGVLADVLGNGDLKWESTYGANVGIDFSLFNERIGGSIEGYDTRTKDLVLYRTLPAATGYLNVVSNIGKVANKGLEITLRTQNIITKDFRWETNFSFATNQNKIVDLYGDKKDDVGNRFFIGHPVNVVYDYKMTGVWQAGEDPSKQDPTATPGDLKFEDKDHSGSIDANDRMILGQTIPKWTGGLTSTWHYKNFHLNVFIQTAQGITQNNDLINFRDFGGRMNLPTGIGYWTEANKSASRPKLTYVNYLNYGYVSNASYTRIKDATLSYSMPSATASKIGIAALTLYVTGRNLVTFTKWKGWDPEAGYGTTGDTEGNYPLVRSFILGANITLR